MRWEGIYYTIPLILMFEILHNKNFNQKKKKNGTESSHQNKNERKVNKSWKIWNQDAKIDLGFIH